MSDLNTIKLIQMTKHGDAYLQEIDGKLSIFYIKITDTNAQMYTIRRVSPPAAIIQISFAEAADIKVTRFNLPLAAMAVLVNMFPV